ncbi:flavin reductase family protein [Pseudomonas sp. KSR10]|uniref:Flavin reductase n=1 Tax=Stutzerimonas stutzeri TaxID=316 RepID=A0A0D9AP26_STUST|nr:MULTISPECIES: flavin reductase family protein [Pseudomonadaceae]KJH82770.1 flavin reductase [Stutzerimonas stutzeri]MCG6542557.1 flavin reductase family protein [Pseudomonas sp. KSR10]
MQLDFCALTPAERYRWLTSTITPRPIAWVSTRSTDGISNLAPFSFFQVISSEPPTLLINVGLKDGMPKDTARNARDTGELVVQLVGAEQVEAMNASAAVLPHGISEFEHCGIASEPAKLVNVPRVCTAPVAFECRVAQILPYPAESPNCHLIFAEVLLAHVADGLLDERGRIDPARLDVVGRLGGISYTYTRERFEMLRPQ